MVEKNSCQGYVTKHTVNHDDTSPLTLYTAGDGDGIIGCAIKVTETWDDGSKAFTVGDAADPDGFAEDLAASLEATGYYNIEHDEMGAYLWHVIGSHRRTHIYAAAGTIAATFVGTGGDPNGSQGQCIVYLLHQDYK